MPINPITSSPGASVVTLRPTAMTVPATSTPGVNGNRSGMNGDRNIRAGARSGHYGR